MGLLALFFSYIAAMIRLLFRHPDWMLMFMGAGLAVFGFVDGVPSTVIFGLVMVGGGIAIKVIRNRRK